MNINIHKNLALLFLTSIFLFSCSQKSSKLDIDLSNLPKPKKVVKTTKENNNLLNFKNREFIKDLVALKDSKQILSRSKLGKKDPFSKGELEVTKLNKDLKLNGFLSANNKNYVFVTYQGEGGSISAESIGGENTNLLPNGAKVISIDPKSMKLTINFDDEKFVFEL